TRNGGQSPTVPDGLDALFGDVAEVEPVGRSDHAARHGQSLVAHVGAAPGPIAALRSRGARWVLAGLGGRRPEVRAPGAGAAAGGAGARGRAWASGAGP